MKGRARPRDELLGSAMELHRKGRLEDAERLYAEILRARPDDADALHLSGVAAHQRGDHRRAVALIEKAVAQNQSNPVFFGHLGEAFRALGRADRASACYGQALRLNPGYRDGHMYMGILLRARGSLEDAAKRFRQALAIDPEHADSHNNLGNVLLDLHSLEEAAASYRRAVAAAPNLAEAHGNLANARRLQGNFDAAMAGFRGAVDLAFPAALAHWQRAGTEGPAEPAADRAGAMRPARQALFDAKAVLDGLGIPFFLCFGTLLGCVREGDFLSHDKDVDLGIWSDAPRVPLAAAFEGAGFRLVSHLTDRDGGFAADIRLPFYHANGMALEVFVHFRESDHVWTGMRLGAERLRWRLPCFGLAPLGFLGAEFAAPDAPEAYLEACYGDWRTPQPDYVASVDACNMIGGFPRYALCSAWHHAWRTVHARDFTRARRFLGLVLQHGPAAADLRRMVGAMDRLRP